MHLDCLVDIKVRGVINCSPCDPTTIVVHLDQLSAVPAPMPSSELVAAFLEIDPHAPFVRRAVGGRVGNPGAAAVAGKETVLSHAELPAPILGHLLHLSSWSL